MTAFLSIDPASEVPLYRQIAKRVQDGVAAGRIRSGDRLPTVRRLATDLAVTRVTIHRAYQLLQKEGIVESTVGRGTFIAVDRPANEESRTGLGWSYAAKTTPVATPVAHAEPDSEQPVEREFLKLHRELDGDLGTLQRYGPVEGDLGLRQEISRLLSERGIAADPEKILITLGSTMALAALVRQLARAGDRVLVEDRTYFGFLALLRDARVEPIAGEMDEHGLLPDALERAILRERPRFLYTIPSFHNPTGSTMTAERRRAVSAVAAKYGLLVIEDDVYHLLSLDGPPPPPLAASSHPDVIYVDSFSKCFLPGLRLGYVVTPPHLKTELTSRIETHVLSGPLTYQRTLAEFLRRGLFDRHLERVRPVYRQRRDSLMEALRTHVGPLGRWTRPEGGYCCWLSLAGADQEERAGDALRRELGLPRSSLFDPRGRTRNGLRLCFGTATPRAIESSIRRLGEILRDREGVSLDRPRPLETRPRV